MAGLSGSVPIMWNIPPSGVPVQVMSLPPAGATIPSVGEFHKNTTGPSGMFGPLMPTSVSSPFVIRQGQLSNESNDVLLISTDPKGSVSEQIPPHLQFNFGNVDITKYYVTGLSLNDDTYKVYTES